MLIRFHLLDWGIHKMTLSYILSMIHDGQWFGFSDSKNQTYENLIILDSQYTKPTEDEIETKKVCEY